MKNLLIDMFNIKEEDIELFNTSNREDGSVAVSLRLKKRNNDLFCPVCGNKLVGNGTKLKPVKHKILTDRNMEVFYEARRYRCKSCNYSEYEKNPLSISGFSVSIPVMNRVMIDLHDPRYNYTMIAEKNSISVNEVINYFDSFVCVPKQPLGENIGIDEIHSDMAKRKDASYLGVITNNDRFALIDILPSRSKYEISKFLSSYSKEEREKVLYVTIDMWEPYLKEARRWLPNCTVAVDPFHVIEHLTLDFTKIRVRIMNGTVYGSPSYYLLKTWHKLLESDKFNLNGNGKYNHVFHQKLNYGELLKMILEIDDELRLAYELKEAYRIFSNSSTFERAEEEINDLISAFQRSNIKEYEEFTSLLVHWKKEIINSFIRSPVTGSRLSNAKSESMNMNIKTHIRISKGLSNFLRFRKRMIYCFNDHVFYALTSKLTSMKRNFKKKRKTQ